MDLLKSSKSYPVFFKDSNRLTVLRNCERNSVIPSEESTPTIYRQMEPQMDDGLFPMVSRGGLSASTHHAAAGES
jgi:hypothetical protein